MVFQTKVNRLLNRSVNSSVHSVMIDFSKAFDRLSWGWIMSSLEECGISNNCSRWYHNFVGNEDDRKIMVKVNESFSDEVIVTSGNIQGSKPGPRIFNVAVEPLMHSILELNSNPRYKDANEIHVLFYADDMKVFILVQNWLDHKKLKAAIEIIKTFCNPFFFYIIS